MGLVILYPRYDVLEILPYFVKITCNKFSGVALDGASKGRALLLLEDRALLLLVWCGACRGEGGVANAPCTKKRMTAAVGRYAPTASGGSRAVCADGPVGAVGLYAPTYRRGQSGCMHRRAGGTAGRYAPTGRVGLSDGM